jgi:hypothetical protein
MTREGLLRSAAVLNSPALDLVSADVRWDAEVWSVLAAEWPTTPSTADADNRA